MRVEAEVARLVDLDSRCGFGVLTARSAKALGSPRMLLALLLSGLWSFQRQPNGISRLEEVTITATGSVSG
jgi:hypothetical protein